MEKLGGLPGGWRRGTRPVTDNAGQMGNSEQQGSSSLLFRFRLVGQQRSTSQAKSTKLGCVMMTMK